MNDASAAQEKSYDVTLPESSLITIIEHLVLMAVLHEHSTEVPGNKSFGLLFAHQIQESYCAAARDLLRVPLQDPRFRKEFNEHFENHPAAILRTAGVEWLDEVLIFED